MEKFIYIGNVSGSISLLYPVESWRGAHPASDTTLNLFFTPITEGGMYPDKDNDIITVTTTDNNKHKDVLEALVEEVNYGEKGVTILFDADTGEKVHTQIASVSYTASSNV